MERVLQDGNKITIREHGWLADKLLPSFAPPIPREPQPSPEETANWFSSAMFSWLEPIMRTGYARLLEMNDVYLAPSQHLTAVRMRRVEIELAKMRQKNPNGKYYETIAILIALRPILITCVILGFLFIGTPVATAVVSRKLVSEVGLLFGGKRNHGRAVGLSIAFIVLQLVEFFGAIHAQYLSEISSKSARALLIALGQRKLLRLSPRGIYDFPASQVTSLLSTDTRRIEECIHLSVFVVPVIPVFGALIGVLVWNLGPAGLTGVGLFALCLAIGAISASGLSWLRLQSLPFADKRIGLVRETLEKMRVVKLYGWEIPFYKQVIDARKSESKWLARLGMAQSANNVFINSLPAFSGALSFSVRILIGHMLSPERAFPSLTLFNLLAPVSALFVQGVTAAADGWNSLKRLDEFFSASETESYIGNPPPGLAIHVVNATLQWFGDQVDDSERTEKEKKDFKAKKDTKDIARDGHSKSDLEKAGLKDVNLDVGEGDLVMVIGSIGSGKSTLLHALLGGVDKAQGSISVSQPAFGVLNNWSMNATIRDNILFGRKWDPERYHEVISACALDIDLKELTAGDLTEIGEKGVTLSGGQRARLALARCVYAKGSVVLLDDVLSAVDSHVANVVFTKCILGLLSGATRIMATNNLALLPHADRVAFVDGETLHYGTFQHLLSTNSSFAKFHSSFHAENAEEKMQNAKPVAIKPPLKISGSNARLEDHIHEASEVAQNLAIEANGPITALPMAATVEFSEEEERKDKEILVNGTLIQEESRARGTVKGSILLEYFWDGTVTGGFLLVLVVLFEIISAGAEAMESVFLQFWTEMRFDEPQGFYIGVYCAIVVIQAASYAVGISLLTYFGITASSRLHNLAIKSLYRAPMSYFDTTPLGRLVNRFSEDVGQLDTMLLMWLRMVSVEMLQLLASSVVTFVYVPWGAVCLVPILIVCLLFLAYYRPTTRELNRISNVYRSSMFTALQESISGVSVIRTYCQAGTWIDSLDSKLDFSNYSSILNTATHYWMALRVTLSAAMMTIVVVFLSIFRVFDLSVSSVALMMTTLPSVANALVDILPFLALLENELNSVERLHELGHNVPRESTDGLVNVARTWPESGKIEFVNASLRYRDGLPNAMKNLSMIIPSAGKIGIVGRTGAGKSTLLSALFRIAELSGGKILIDGVDIAHVDLDILRSRLTIIPQEPVLFQGTIRSNLDPVGEHSDSHLWDALKRSGALSLYTSSAEDSSKQEKFHLDSKVSSDGTNFSLGERQLLTLARALVRRSQILVLDEATSSVDAATDQMIQRTLAEEFKDCTVLCIAHRLQTILSYDQVLVMEAGRRIEMGSPLDLVLTPGSKFGSMIEDASISLDEVRARVAAT